MRDGQICVGFLSEEAIWGQLVGGEFAREQLVRVDCSTISKSLVLGEVKEHIDIKSDSSKMY